MFSPLSFRYMVILSQYGSEYNTASDYEEKRSPVSLFFGYSYAIILQVMIYQKGKRHG